MVICLISDTHKDSRKVTKYIIREAKKRGAEIIFHFGDIELQHINSELYGGLPVICALTDDQVKDDKKDQYLAAKPPNWIFTFPNERIVDLEVFLIYVGHKKLAPFLGHPKHELYSILNKFSKDYDNLKVLGAGHTHHQVLIENGSTCFINPGAVEGTIGFAGGHEFAILDTDKDEITFSRIFYPMPTKKSLTLGIISDSKDISEMDGSVWPKLADKFKKEEVTHIIHCGNIDTEDIGLDILSDFQVSYYLRSNQVDKKDKPDNWTLITDKNPLVEIEGYRFYVQLNLSQELLGESEFQMYNTALKILETYSETKFILCGNARNAFLEEGQDTIILNPGDLFGNNHYAIVKLPLYEITFGRLKKEELPPLED